MNIRHLFLSLTLMTASASAVAEEFLCDLKIGKGHDAVLEVKDRPVRVSNEAELVNAFEDLAPLLKKSGLAHTYYLVQAKGGEIEIGLFYYNKLDPRKVREMSTASADGKTKIKLNTQTPSGVDVQFSCRNKNFEI